jgi:hypothetical protein
LRIEVIGFEARAVLAGAAIFAVSAGEIFLQRDVIAFLDAPAIARDVAELLDSTDDLVAQDAGAELAAEIFAPVAAADPRRDHAQQPGIGGDVGQRELAQFGLARARHHGGKGGFGSHAILYRSAPTP